MVLEQLRDFFSKLLLHKDIKTEIDNTSNKVNLVKHPEFEEFSKIREQIKNLFNYDRIIEDLKLEDNSSYKEKFDTIVNKIKNISDESFKQDLLFDLFLELKFIFEVNNEDNIDIKYYDTFISIFGKAFSGSLKRDVFNPKFDLQKLNYEGTLRISDEVFNENEIYDESFEEKTPPKHAFWMQLKDWKIKVVDWLFQEWLNTKIFKLLWIDYNIIKS